MVFSLAMIELIGEGCSWGMCVLSSVAGCQCGVSALSITRLEECCVLLCVASVIILHKSCLVVHMVPWGSFPLYGDEEGGGIHNCFYYVLQLSKRGHIENVHTNFIT